MANNQESTRDDARNQALAQIASIEAMIAAYDVDYDRLEELRDERDNYTALNRDGHMTMIGADWAKDNPDDAEELAELENAAGECKDQDEAETRIREDALCVEYRSGWTSDKSEFSADEFRILLCTGGPHVEIVGEIDHRGEPSRCWIVYKDWGTSGELTGADFDHDTVLRYCGFFISGE